MMHPIIYATDSVRITGGPIFDHAPWPELAGANDDYEANIAAEQQRHVEGQRIWREYYREDVWPFMEG
jgi:hypothetical protein